LAIAQTLIKLFGLSEGWGLALSVKIGSLLGIAVKLHHTLIIAVPLIAWTLAEGFMPLE
jgi:hypothetical protein